MRSKATFLGHPLHPILIAFPIGFLVGGLLFDLAGWLLDVPSLWTTGAYLSVAAVASGLIAAVPGFIDYLYVIPPNSSGKKRGFQHMLVNVGALLAFVAGGAFRDWDSFRPAPLTLLFEVAGVGLVIVGGYLGGTLVYRNQIGIDHRYARAGKWKEQVVDAAPGQSVVVARAGELEPDQMKLLHAGDRRIVLARTEGGYVAFDDHCPHRGGSLAGGVMACGTVQCPWHGSQFDVRSGAVKAGPADRGVATYAVHEAAGEVRLTIPPAG